MDGPTGEKEENTSEFITSVLGVCYLVVCRGENISRPTAKMTEKRVRFNSQPPKSYTCMKSDFKGTREISYNRTVSVIYAEQSVFRVLKNRFPSDLRI